MKSIKYVKFAIIAFYLIVSYWVTALIFEKEFAATAIKHAVDSKYENTLMILLISTGFSAIAVFLLGLLSLFTNFVFVRLVFTDEIKSGAMAIINKKRRQYKFRSPRVKPAEVETTEEEIKILKS